MNHFEGRYAIGTKKSVACICLWRLFFC